MFEISCVSRREQEETASPILQQDDGVYTPYIEPVELWDQPWADSTIQRLVESDAKSNFLSVVAKSVSSGPRYAYRIRDT